mmetsp:Transcript_142589/g.251648  ORF Transcript_142589/g.251648 Transcript_142589/m.251648 type:complete len:104 (-) Transcript_142589:265-576(-)
MPVTNFGIGRFANLGALGFAKLEAKGSKDPSFSVAWNTSSPLLLLQSPEGCEGSREATSFRGDNSVLGRWFPSRSAQGNEKVFGIALLLPKLSDMGPDLPPAE